MSRNWLRQCYLQLDGKSTKIVSGGGSEDLRIVFVIEPSTLQAPNMANFRIYNPSRSTVSKLRAKEFTKLEFYAGYQDNAALIYSGDIKQTRDGHETATDSFVDIFCGDGDAGYVQARTTKTLAAGYTPQDKLNVAMDAFKPFGITLGTVNVDLSQPKFPRGLPLIGMARDIVRQVALSAGAVWSIQNGKLDIIDHRKPLQTNVVEMNGKTGMIGWPEQTPDGINVISLINPALRPNVKIKINNAAILQAQRANGPLDEVSPRNFDLENTGKLSADGVYTILYMSRHGDTRGPNWFDECTCIAADDGAYPNDAERKAGFFVGNA